MAVGTRLTHHKTPAKDPDHFQRRRGNAVRQSNHQHHSDDADDQFFPVYELATEPIPEQSEDELTENVADIGPRIHQTSQPGRIVVMPVLVLPHRRHEIDDEEVVRV